MKSGKQYINEMRLSTKRQIIKNQAEILEFKNTKIEKKNRLEGFNKQTKVRISELNEII